MLFHKLVPCPNNEDSLLLQTLFHRILRLEDGFKFLQAATVGFDEEKVHEYCAGYIDNDVEIEEFPSYSCNGDTGGELVSIDHVLLWVTTRTAARSY